MLRFFAGVASALLLVAAGMVWWHGGARARSPVPAAVLAATPVDGIASSEDPAPPQASDKTREQKRFDRYDHDRNGAVSREEWLATRRKAFARLDTNGDGKLSFEEWAAKTITRFTTADSDKNGALTPTEFATTRIVRKSPATRRAVDCPPQASGEDNDS